MRKLLLLTILFITVLCYQLLSKTKSKLQPIKKTDEATIIKNNKSKQEEIRIAQFIATNSDSPRYYPSALPSLLKFINNKTTANIAEQPVIIHNFADSRIFKYPFIYLNFVELKDYLFSQKEKTNLKRYLTNGGFLYIDAGINADFLNKKTNQGQHHSYAEWRVTPQVKKIFAEIFPNQGFFPLKHSHPIFSCFYKGLPDCSDLPSTVKKYVQDEKWPDGTYSVVGLTINNRLAVIATPILAMGWGKDSLENWETKIRLRVRETAKNLSEQLKTAAYNGVRYTTIRESGAKEIIYCQKNDLPAWVQEPNGKWRVFRYYGSREISDFSHIFYTRLATNFIIYALNN